MLFLPFHFLFYLCPLFFPFSWWTWLKFYQLCWSFSSLSNSFHSCFVPSKRVFSLLLAPAPATQTGAVPEQEWPVQAPGWARAQAAEMPLCSEMRTAGALPGSAQWRRRPACSSDAALGLSCRCRPPPQRPSLPCVPASGSKAERGRGSGWGVCLGNCGEGQVSGAVRTYTLCPISAQASLGTRISGI